MWDPEQLDPVVVLGLTGQPVGSMPCPYMLPPEGKRGKPRACGEQAFLLRFPDPYGYRARCEDGHVVVLAKTAVPGLVTRMKGETD